MRKAARMVAICLCAVAVYWTVSLLRDRSAPNEHIIQLHVVTDSDSKNDHTVMQQVRDNVSIYLSHVLKDATSLEQAEEYIIQKLPIIRDIANATLEQLGADERAEVTLAGESFNAEEYDSVSLPSSVYDVLRIIIKDADRED